MSESENIPNIVETGSSVRKESEFPSNIEGRMEAILSSFNVSPKTVTMLLLSEAITDPSSLSRTFRDTVVGSSISEFDVKTASSYCHQSLCPIGLVAEEITLDYYGHDKIIGFALTRAGSEYGQPIAAFFLDFERKNGISLYPIFGQTQKARGEHRGPINRAQILKELQEGEKREVEIATQLGISIKTTGNSLTALQRAGVISYHSVKTHTGREKISFTPTEMDITKVQPIPHSVALTRDIVGLCQTLSQEGISVTTSSIYDHLPQKYKRRRYLNNAISGVLSGLAEQGFLERIRGFKMKERQSTAKLTEKGRLLVEELIIPLEDALSDGSSLQMLRSQVLPQVRRDLPVYARETANLYYAHSRSFGSKGGKEERQTHVLSYLLLKPEGVSIEELSTELGKSPFTIRDDLKYLMKEGQIVRIKKRGVTYYSPETKN